MRIITGSARGRRLETLSGEETRPTSEKVKEALFSAIQFDIEGRRVLDLFAGSGQLGIEALSRGASGCVFVDRNPAAVEVIRRNLKAAGLSEASQAVAQDVASFLVRPGDSFDVAFLDPPYGSNLPRAGDAAHEPGRADRLRKRRGAGDARTGRRFCAGPHLPIRTGAYLAVPLGNGGAGGRLKSRRHREAACRENKRDIEFTCG